MFLLQPQYCYTILREEDVNIERVGIEMINDFSISDGELIYMLNQRSSCSLERLLAYYDRLIWKRSHEALAHGDITTVDVEDLYQEGLIGFYQALYGFRPDLNVGLAYYLDLCINSSIKTAVRKLRTISYRLIDSRCSLDIYISEDENITLLDTIQTDHFQSCPMNMAVYEEINDLRLAYVQTLPEHQQYIFELHETGYSYKEIARSVCLTDKDVDNTIQKIRRKTKSLYVVNNN